MTIQKCLDTDQTLLLLYMQRKFLPKLASTCIEKTFNNMSADKSNSKNIPVVINGQGQDTRRAARRSRSEENIGRDPTWSAYSPNYVLNPVCLMSQRSPYQYMDYQYYQNQLSYNLIQDVRQQRFMSHYNRRSCSMDTTDRKKNRSKNNKDHQLLASRVWENVTTAETESKNTKKAQKPGVFFTVMSYNVLAQELLTQHPELYRNCNQTYLNWETRWNNLLKEIQSLSPDILCLQEVQESHLKGYFSVLETLGYKGLFKKRTGVRVDGCAIYYKDDVIKLIEYETVEYYQPSITLLNRDNIALIAKFAPRLHPTREFVVATTHLLYNPRRQDVRLAQMQVLLAEVERLSFRGCQAHGGCYSPVILTGDLNSTPDSAIYDLITKGTLNYEELSGKSSPSSMGTGINGKMLVPPCLKITDSCQHANLLEKREQKQQINRTQEISLIELHNSEKKVEKRTVSSNKYSNLFGSGTLSHHFAFKSIYNHGEPNNVEGTTFQNEWVTVDYVFYSGKKESDAIIEDKLKLISRYKLPRKSELASVAIPNKYLGSDHLSLAAKFKLEF